SVPTFGEDAPGGGGKIPVAHNYVISQSYQKTVLRNFEGVITTYPEPDHYQEHDSENCEYCQAAEGKNVGLASLMADERINLEPKVLSREERRGDFERKKRRIREKPPITKS